ncbi:MAG: hypothetical protein WCO56_25455 [Verrucomicrobiota bacterium]
MLRIIHFSLVATLAGWLISPCVYAATYYVATNGNDAYTTNQAKNISTPWQTINRAASNLVAGDTCLIRAGTYRETVTVRASGTSNAPLTFQAYSNEIVTLDGTDSLTGWATSGSNIWTAPMGWTLGDGDQVFINGAMKPAARWPNAGISFPWQNSLINPSPDWSYLDTVGYTSNTNGWFTDASLPTHPDGYWNGASVHILSGHGWIMNHPTVTGYTNASKKIVTNDPNGANAAYAFAAGNEYYLTGIIGEMDSPGEWFYQTNTLFLYATNTPTGVTAKHRNYGFDLRGRDFINLVDLNFFACTIQTDTSSTDHTFDGLVMQYLGHSAKNSSVSGLVLRDRSVLRNSELGWDSRYLLSLSGSDIRAINNNLHDSGYVPNWDAMVGGSGYRNLFSHNTLQHSGRGLMGSMGRAALMEYNDLSDAMKLTSDGAAFYTYFEAGNTVFRYNLIHDSPGPKGHSGSGVQGFYLDCENSNWIVHHNIIWNLPASAIQINCRHNFNQFFNNTCWGTSGALSSGFASDGETGTHIFNNLFDASPSGSTWGYSDVRFNFTNSPVFVAPSNGDFRLQAGSPAMDAGILIPGMTDGFLGAGPDLGALEYGGPNWTTNAGWSAIPPSPDPVYNLPVMSFANQVRDGSFESGKLAPNWTTNAGSALTLLSGSAWTDRRLRTGSYTLQFNVGTSEISQVVTGLLAKCAYKAYAGIQTTNTATTVRFGVRNSGTSGVELLVPANTNADPNGAVSSSTMWKMHAIAFTTGPTNTSAQIYLNVSIPNGVTPVYADDFGVGTDTRTDADTGWSIVNDSNSGITYSAGWTYASGRSSYGDYLADVHYTTTNGNYAQYTFTGTGVWFITETYTNAGTVDIYLDTVFQTTVDRNSATRLGQVVAYANTSLASGTHTIKVVKKSGTYLEFDAFAYLSGAGPYAPPTAPTGLTATVANLSEIDLAWAASGAAVNYNVKRGTASGGPYPNAVAGVVATNYSDTGVTALTNYYYVVSAVNGFGESTNSAEAGTPPYWLDTDIGTVGLAGSGTVNGGAFTVQGAGSDIGGTNDTLNFMYRTMTSDGTIMARLANQVIGGTLNDKVGLMMRETTNANARMATVILNSGYGKNRFGSRASTGGSATWIDGSTNISVPLWYKLTRAGSTFTGYVSTNGTAWTNIASATVTMSNSIVVGMAVCSRETTALNSSTFDNVMPQGALTQPVLMGGTFDSHTMTLNLGGPNGQSYRVLMTTNLLTPLSNWWILTNSAFNSAPNFTDLTATNDKRFYRILSP